MLSRVREANQSIYPEFNRISVPDSNPHTRLLRPEGTALTIDPVRSKRIVEEASEHDNPLTIHGHGCCHFGRKGLPRGPTKGRRYPCQTNTSPPPLPPLKPAARRN